MQSIFINEDKDMSQKEINTLLQLAKKFYYWRKGDFIPSSDEMLPIAWLEGKFAGDSIGNSNIIKIAISDHPQLFNRLTEGEDVDNES